MGSGRLIARIACIAYGAAIFVASSLPAPTIGPGAAGGFPWDKVYHIIEFFTLGALSTAALGDMTVRGRSSGPWIGFALAGAYGGLDELHQALVPSRVGDPWDVVANLVGAALGATVVWGALRLRTFTDPSPRA